MFDNLPVASANPAEVVFTLPNGMRGVMTLMDYRSSKMGRRLGISKITDLRDVIRMGGNAKVKVISAGRDEYRVVMVE